jgi:acetyl-CoA acetyltransferase
MNPDPLPSSVLPTTDLGVILGMSQIQLHADAALNTLKDAGLKPSDIDGIATAGETPTTVAHYLGITPTWVDGTAVGGCSFMIHVRHAAAAINEGLCKTVLITQASGKSRVGAFSAAAVSGRLAGCSRRPSALRPLTMFMVPVLPMVTTYHRRVVAWWLLQRGGQNPRATFKEPITVADVRSGDAYPFRIRVLLGHGGGGDYPSAPSAKDFPRSRSHPGHRRDVESPMISQMEDFTSRVPRVGQEGLDEAGINKDVDHLMIYDASPTAALWAGGPRLFPARGRAFIGARNTAPGGKLPFNTNGGA